MYATIAARQYTRMCLIRCSMSVNSNIAKQANFLEDKYSNSLSRSRLGWRRDPNPAEATPPARGK